MKEHHSKIVIGIIFSGISLFFIALGIVQLQTMPTQPSCDGHAMSAHGTCYRPLKCTSSGYVSSCTDPHTNTYAQELKEEIIDKQDTSGEFLVVGVMFLFLIFLLMFKKNPFFIAAKTAIRSFPGNISRKLKHLLQKKQS
jgi:hypothetical protein